MRLNFKLIFTIFSLYFLVFLSLYQRIINFYCPPLNEIHSFFHLLIIKICSTLIFVDPLCFILFSIMYYFYRIS
jgi:hypothetical protein